MKPSLYLIMYYAMDTYGRVEVWLHAFLISKLDAGQLSASPPGALRQAKAGWYGVGWAPEPVWTWLR